MKECLKCGASAIDESKFCPACGAELGSAATGAADRTTGFAAGESSSGGSPSALPVPPPKYLPWSIVLLVVSSVCLCNPASLVLSIIALVFGTQIDELVRTGKLDVAKGKSKNARIMLIIATVLNVLWLVIVIIGYVAAMAMQLKGLNLL